MARLPRFVVPGQPQHVIVRGNNRSNIFCSDADYLFYLDKLQLACDKFPCKIHAYALMPNHVHLLVSPQEEQSLSKSLQMLGRCYVQHFNHRHQRTGTLWEGRYKATLIDSEAYLLNCMRYIELNPVRAGIVEQPGDYPWSSYNCNALGQPNKLVCAYHEYLCLGKTDEERQAAYRQLFEHHLPPHRMEEIRDATNKAWVLGNDSFKQRMQKQLGRRIVPCAKGGDRKSEKFKINRV